MSNRKLYFAKVNLNSHIYDYYDGKIEMDEIIKSILFNINEVDIFKEENIYKDEVVYEANYSFYNINKKNELGIIYGQILKRGSIIIKSVDKNKNEISKKPIENDELIKFYYDIENELIIFHVTNRYGYLQFCSSFQNLLNRCMESNGSELKFIVTLLRESVSVNSMREKLNKLRGINWLKVSIMPPNPNENVLRNIRKNGKKYLSKYKEGNITGISTIFMSNSPDGVNLESEEVRKSLDVASYVDENIEEKEGISKGYTEIEAHTKSGSILSTKDCTPISYEVDEVSLSDILLFEQACSSLKTRYIAGKLSE